MDSVLSHIAILVTSVDATTERCRESGWDTGPVEEFPDEGTREVYVGPPDHGARLLLLEAIGPGPYQNALKERGPGLHHVAVEVESVDAYVAGLAGTGWLLHPASLRTFAGLKAVWLARPGLQCLIEVQETPPEHSPIEAPRFIEGVSVEGASGQERLLGSLGVSGLRLVTGQGPQLLIEGRTIPVLGLVQGQAP